MQLQLTHWCARQFELRPICYLQKIEMKPHGLWFDVDDDWRRWIEAEDMLGEKWMPKNYNFPSMEIDKPYNRFKFGRRRNFWRDRLKFCYNVHILDAKDVLHMSTPEELDRFTKAYVGLPSELRRVRVEVDGKEWHSPLENMFIDWRRVTHDYKGIIISPYCWERRHELMWYYGWDCASGLVWDTNILSLEPRRPNSRSKEGLQLLELATL